MRKRPWPQEIARKREYGNFRVPPWERKHQPSWAKIDDKQRKSDEQHLAMIRQMPCACCAANPYQYKIDPHHLRGGRYTYVRGMGQKTPDSAVIPLCRDCHNEVETLPSKKQPDFFFKENGFNAEEMADSYQRKRGQTLEAYGRVAVSFQLQRAAVVLKQQKLERENSAAGRRRRALNEGFLSDD